MPIEPNYRRIGDLDKTLPADNDPVAEGDDHMRGVKSSLLGNFTSTATELWGRLVETGPAVIKFLQNAVRVQTNSDTADQSIAFRNAADDADQAALTFSPSTLAFIMETLRDGDALAFRTRVGGVPGTPLLGDAFLGGRLGYQNQGYKVGVSSEGGQIAGDGNDVSLEMFVDVLGGNRRLSVASNEIANTLAATVDNNHDFQLIVRNSIIMETDPDQVFFRSIDGDLRFIVTPSTSKGNSGARVAANDDNNFPVGFNVLPFVSITGNIVVTDNYCGYRLEATGGTHNFTLDVGGNLAAHFMIEITTDTGAGVRLQGQGGQQFYLYRGTTFGREGPYSQVDWPQGTHARVARRGDSDVFDVLDSGPVGVP